MNRFNIVAASLLAIGMMQPVSADNDQGGQSADQPLSLDALAGAFGWDLAGAQVRQEKVADGLYVLFGVGGNIGVSIGSDGVLIVDDQFPQVMEKIEAAIGEIGGDGVDYAINTHWHFDHAEGNNALSPKERRLSHTVMLGPIWRRADWSILSSPSTNSSPIPRLAGADL